MISKNEVKYIQSLSDKKNRDKEGVFVAEGATVTQELLHNGVRPKLIYTTDQQFSFHDAEIRKIPQTELERISRRETANGMLAVFHKPQLPPLRFEKRITLVLDGIQDPGNLGTIIRTADWFGVTQILATRDTADCFNSKVVQSTMGSIARVAVHYTDILPHLQQTPLPVYGALLKGENIFACQPMREGFIIIGNEAKGIREPVLPFVKQGVTIPRIGGAESLNAGVAAGILLFHFTQK